MSEEEYACNGSCGTGEFGAMYKQASPCHHMNLPQNLLEPVMVRYVTTRVFSVRFDTELVSFREENGGERFVCLVPGPKVSTLDLVDKGNFCLLIEFAGVGIWAIWTQFFPPANSAPITEKNLPRQDGKVFIITGGSSGIGFELCKILYGVGGKVYMLTRSKSNAADARSRIIQSFDETDANQTGIVDFIHMDLEDLASVQTAAKEFLLREKRLNVLFNNAGVASVKDRKTKQGLEYHFGVNSVGHILLQKLLMPLLAETAQMAPADSVRVIWSASILTELMSPLGGISVDHLNNPSADINEHYSASKTGNWFAASEFAKRVGRRQASSWYYPFRPALRDPIHGAWTYLWMAFYKDVTMDDAVTGKYAMCDGRWHPGQREDLLLALKTKEEGGTGQAAAYFDWCETKVGPFLLE
ncbi:NAD(P)-binding protein [Amniculicola lignicola CBS 123094]|uniref:NAD(P)-binding protein n=1 Tax=Amniculicola lignicola CBS 123094 TaxID=1392246 RepID=A0A6A5W736_9PLEO|nr:NAD(P)-binding protein [Amniculicola lignicola CBS 123094]